MFSRLIYDTCIQQKGFYYEFLVHQGWGVAGSSPPAWLAIPLAISKPVTCPCKASIKNWTRQSLIMCHNWVSWLDADPAQSSDLGKYRVLSEHGTPNQFTLKINLPFQPKWKTENILFMIVLLDFI